MNQTPTSPAPPADSASPVIRFERVHAMDDAGQKGRPRGMLQGFSLALGAGVHAIVGTPEDGTIALLDALAGARVPLRGSVWVAGKEPAKNPSVRARIGSLGALTQICEANTLEMSMNLMMRARGETSPSPAAVLAPLGLGALAPRRPRTLSYAETRAIELALALTTPAPLAVALYEPLVDVAVQQIGAVRDRIAEIGASGACVLVITSSVADAESLANRVYFIQRGQLAFETSGHQGLPIPEAMGAPAEMIVWIRNPIKNTPEPEQGVRALAAALSNRPEVRSISWEEIQGLSPGSSTLRLRARTLEACSAALIEASLETGVTIDAMAPVMPGLSRVRATFAALMAKQGGPKQPAPSKPAEPVTAQEPPTPGTDSHE